MGFYERTPSGPGEEWKKMSLFNHAGKKSLEPVDHDFFIITSHPFISGTFILVPENQIKLPHRRRAMMRMHILCVGNKKSTFSHSCLSLSRENPPPDTKSHQDPSVCTSLYLPKPHDSDKDK
jgi:hypothetical protein